MSDKEELRNMLTNIVDDNTEQAQTHFHTYLQGKMQDVMKDEDDDDAAEDADK